MATASISTFITLFLTAGLTAQALGNQAIPLKNWTAPLSWQPRGQSPHATSTGSLVFVALTPCRAVDTRASQGFAAPFGPPSLIANATRSFAIQLSACSIPSDAQAYSLNVTVIPPGPLGYLTIWPTGQVQPNAVTLDDITGDIRNNAAIVPAGTPNGSVNVHVNAATDLVLDINGYYTPSKGASSDNTSLGTSALAANSAGSYNVAIGSQALAGNIAGYGNTATGFQALSANTYGYANVATGLQALASNTTGQNNTAIGQNALFANTAGQENTAIGQRAMVQTRLDMPTPRAAAARLLTAPLGITTARLAIRPVSSSPRVITIFTSEIPGWTQSQAQSALGPATETL